MMVFQNKANIGQQKYDIQTMDECGKVSKFSATSGNKSYDLKFVYKTFELINKF